MAQKNCPPTDKDIKTCKPDDPKGKVDCLKRELTMIVRKIKFNSNIRNQLNA